MSWTATVAPLGYELVLVVVSVSAVSSQTGFGETAMAGRCARWRRVVFASVAGAVMLVAGNAGSAAAGTPGFDAPPHPGWFVRSAPLYAESVDGWSCHFGGACRSDERGLGDPSPVSWAAAGQTVQIECEFGSYYLVDAGGESPVWAPRGALVSDYRQVDCSPPDWW